MDKKSTHRTVQEPKYLLMCLDLTRTGTEL